MNSVLYIAGKAQQVPGYSGAVIDEPTLEQALAEHTKRIALDAVSAQQQIDDRALSGLANLKAESLQHQQRLDQLTKQLNDASLLQVSATDLAEEAKAQAAAAAAAVAQVPAVDVSAVARLSAEVIENGARTVNQAARAQQLITDLTDDTSTQLQTLRSEVVTLQGTATETVTGIQQASEAAVSDAIARVDELLAAVPEQTRQTILGVLGETEYLIGGEVDPQDRYSFNWQFAKLSDPETVTRTVPMPIYVGFRGAPGKSGSPIVGGGGGGGGTGSLYLQANLTPSVESPLKIKNRTNTALGGRDFKGHALVKFSINQANQPDNWVTATLDLAAAMNAPGAGVFTVAAELQGPGTPPEFTFRVEQLGAGVNSNIALFVTCNVQAEFLGTFLEIQP